LLIYKIVGNITELIPVVSQSFTFQLFISKETTDVTL